MPSAICPHCHEPAFSSADFRRMWICPTCGKVVLPRFPEHPKKPFDPEKESIVDFYSRFWKID